LVLPLWVGAASSGDIEGNLNILTNQMRLLLGKFWPKFTPYY